MTPSEREFAALLALSDGSNRAAAEAFRSAGLAASDDSDAAVLRRAQKLAERADVRLEVEAQQAARARRIDFQAQKADKAAFDKIKAMQRAEEIAWTRIAKVLETAEFKGATAAAVAKCMELVLKARGDLGADRVVVSSELPAAEATASEERIRALQQRIATLLPCARPAREKPDA